MSLLKTVDTYTSLFISSLQLYIIGHIESLSILLFNLVGDKRKFYLSLNI